MYALALLHEHITSLKETYSLVVRLGWVSGFHSDTPLSIKIIFLFHSFNV